MDRKKLEEIIHIISKEDTSPAELLFDKPGGRKYFESLVLVVVNNLPYTYEEKTDVFRALIKGLDKMEHRIQHQKKGQKILKEVFS